MAKIFLVEDHDKSREIAKGHLRRAGHQVIDANNLSLALDTVSALKTLKIDIAILDGNLKPDDTSGNDGIMIAKSCRQNCEGILIICWSRQKYDYGDVYCAKGPDYSLLVQAVADLLKNKTASDSETG